MINRYTVKDGDKWIFAYSPNVFQIGEHVKVTHNTRWDGIQVFQGTVTAQTMTATRNGKILSIFDNKLLEIGTIDITRA